MKNFIFLSLFLLIFFSGCSSKQSSDIDAQKTQEVLEHHWDAFVANDLEEVMKDYSEESVLITPNATYRGLDEIRENFVNAFKAFPKGESTLNLEKSVVEKEVGYILWNAETPSLNLRFGTDTFIVRNGKIVRQTYGGISQSEIEG